MQKKVVNNFEKIYIIYVKVNTIIFVVVIVKIIIVVIIIIVSFVVTFNYWTSII